MQNLDDDIDSEKTLAGLPGWSWLGGRLVRTFVCDDFHSARLFVDRVAAAAEAVDRRPDITVHASTVTVALPLDRDATGMSAVLTADDLALARRIQRLTGDHRHPVGLAGP